MLHRLGCVALVLAFISTSIGTAQTKLREPAKVLVDTDVGDDIDDAFAIDLALISPELKIVGLSSAWEIPRCGHACSIG